MLRQTPVVARGALYFKLENLQVTGSFKARGAWRKLRAMPAEVRARGVVAASAGNHGQGLAYAARHVGAAVTVYVPETTPAVKRDAIARLGARVVVEGAGYDAAEAAARAAARATGAAFVSPFDDDDVIEGNGGGLADELVAQIPDLARVIAPVGGGGLIAGLVRRLRPRGIDVAGAQPRANCAMYESLRQGRALTHYRGAPTIAEGCEGAVCERTFAAVRDGVAEIGLVSEEAIRAAVAWCYRRLGQIVEPTGAVAVAAVRSGAVAAAPAGATAIVVTGGNVDPDLFEACIAASV